MRGATGRARLGTVGHDISIHAPHAGRDVTSQVPVFSGREFQSTRPMRGATSLELCRLCPERISIHAPHAGRDKYGIRRL